MAKLPYGGIECDPADIDDDSWKRLETINEHLEDGEPIPPFLADWLGSAIARSERNPDELLKLLGLKKRRGAPKAHPDDSWLIWGGRVCELENGGLMPEAALKKAIDEFSKIDKDSITRTVMQGWRDIYRRAEKEGEEACRE